MKRVLSSLIMGTTGLLIAAAMPLAARAAGTQVVVTPSDAHGWTTADTRPGGVVSYSMDNSAPGNPHNGALQLTTDASTTAKAQYMHNANEALSGVNTLSYYTKQISASFAQGDPSYQLPVCLSGISAPTTANPTGCNGFTTLVFEPYENLGNNGNVAVVPGDWQKWDVSSPTANLWSTRTVTDGTCSVVAGAGGAPFYNLTALKTACPNAVVVGFGVNIGSNNPLYNVEADLVNFNDTTYNFEPFVSATNKDQCKDNGWMNLTDNNGNAFKNQGQCVSYTNGRGQ